MKTIQLGIQWVSRVTRRESPEEDASLPPRILVLLTVPRTGSTWLFDLLRSNPGIFMMAHSTIIDELCECGRRYPGDLSDGEDADRLVEVQSGKWERIPTYQWGRMGWLLARKVRRRQYAIEKIHPEFFNYDDGRFLDRVSSTEQKGCRVKIVYVVRDPVEAYSSFVKYQERNPKWRGSKTLPEENVIDYMERSFASLLRTARQRRGPVVDYGELLSNPSQVIASVSAFLWDSMSVSRVKALCSGLDKVLASTNRGRRRRTSAAFFGPAGDSSRHKLADGAVPASESTVSVKTRRAYEGILELSQRSW